MQLTSSRIRSFVRREGRMTPGQKRALSTHWPQFGVDVANGPIECQALFPHTSPVILDIGFGMGEALVAQAQAQAQHCFIGIEVHHPGVGKCLAAAHAHALTNLRVFCHDAVSVLTDCIPAQSLASVQIFFPDPWPKKRHHKRRLIQTPFLDLLASKLKPKGVLHIATDWAPYADHLQIVLTQHQSFEAMTHNPFLPKRYRSRFADRGQRLGHQEVDLIYRNNATASL